ncbi:hypothetical protein [Bacillus sp. B1-b2]|uniref:hypothetical protein n=1 Tax=Bacillus sp. B1-b2 TaxID=2653201 RepID=UPI00126246AF|nr:hypothetical protein [Bacillus sp. B1-b2]KAB7672552.1 hypothetical protein F9279_02685 [Bacillus sp. B1-b2]
MNPSAKIFIKTNDIYSLNYGNEVDGLAYLPEDSSTDYIELTVPIEWISEKKGFLSAFGDSFTVKK